MLTRPGQTLAWDAENRLASIAADGMEAAAPVRPRALTVLPPSRRVREFRAEMLRSNGARSTT